MKFYEDTKTKVKDKRTNVRLRDKDEKTTLKQMARTGREFKALPYLDELEAKTVAWQ